MACNCASSEQIKLLYKKYGNKKDEIKKLPTKEKIKHYTQYASVAVAMIVISPFLILYVLYKGLFDDNKKISMRKFFNLKANSVFNVKQQNI